MYKERSDSSSRSAAGWLTTASPPLVPSLQQVLSKFRLEEQMALEDGL